MKLVLWCGVIALVIHFVINRGIDAFELWRLKNNKKAIKKAKELGELWVTLKNKKTIKSGMELFWKMELNVKNGVCISYKTRYDEEENLEYILELMLLSNEDGKPYINFREEGAEKSDVRLGIPVWNTKIVAGYQRLLDEIEKIKEKYNEDVDIKDIMSRIDRIEFYEK